MTTVDVDVTPIQFIELGGYRMAYREWGDVAATETTILVHGITSSSLSWIRCFAMRRAEGSGFLDLTEARRVYHWLNADLGEALPESVVAGPAERAAIRRRCHIGQPVAIGIGGEPAAVLRGFA